MAPDVGSLPKARKTETLRAESAQNKQRFGFHDNAIASCNLRYARRE